MLKLEPALVNMPGNKMRTPLFVAAKEGFLEMVKLLIYLGSDPFATDIDDADASFIALRERNVEVWRWLGFIVNNTKETVTHSAGKVNKKLTRPQSSMVRSSNEIQRFNNVKHIYNNKKCS